MSLPFTYEPWITISLAVTDLARATAWYATHLGFTAMYEAEGAGYAAVTTPNHGTVIGLVESEQVEVLGGATPVFMVTDLPRARATLEAQGVRFDGETIEYPGMVRLCTFFDPDGNKLMFSQSLEADFVSQPVDLSRQGV